MADEVLRSSPEVVIFYKKRLKQFIYMFVCRKGEGLICPQSFLRRIALLWNYVRYLTLDHVFLINIRNVESVDIKLYFHVDIANIRCPRYF